MDPWELMTRPRTRPRSSRGRPKKDSAALLTMAQAEGQADQAKSDLKQAGEQVKDAFKD